MTLLSAFGDALFALDNAIAARRGGGVIGTGGRPFVVPIPTNQPIQLSGESKLITYADTVATHPIVFGVWAKLLRNLVTADIGVYQRDANEPWNPYKLKRVYDTDLEARLREPAPGKGLVDLLQWLFNPYLVEGNGLVAKYRGETGKGTPEGFVPLDWRFMSALAIPGGPVEQWISYQIGEPRALDPSEVVHLGWHGTSGSVIGTSALQALGVTVRLEDGSRRLQIAALDNGNRAAGALVVPEGVETTREDRDEMRDDVNKAHKGVDKAFQLAVLFGGVDWKQMSFTAQEAELINTRKLNRGDVCIAYDVRETVIADLDGGPRVDLKEIIRDFERSLRPHAVLAQNALQRQLIDTEPEWAADRLCVLMDFSALRRGTYSEEMDTAVQAYTNGIAALDEVRPPLGLEPVGEPDAKKPLIPHAQLQPGDVGNTPDGRRLRSRNAGE